MLCNRCEHRIRYIETKDTPSPLQPRSECGQINMSVSSCYCYKPVLPVIVKRTKGDKRPIFSSWMFSGRVRAVEVAKNMVLKLKKTKKGILGYYVTKNET